MVTTRRAAELALAIALLVASAPGAIAQRPDVDEAKQQYELGYEALQAGRFEAALEHYQRSYALVPRPRTLFNIAVSEEMLGRSDDALRHYAEFIELAGDRDEEFKALAKRKIDALSKQLPRDVTEQPPPTRVESGPPTAPADASCRCAPSPSDRLSGTLRVHSNRAGATVSVDGLVIGTTSAAAVGSNSGGTLSYQLAPGEHHAIVESPGTQAWHRRFHVSPGETVSVEVAFGGASGGKVLTWGLAGFGVLGVAAGGTLGVLALRDAASADPSDHARGKTRALVTDLLIVGGAAALYGAWRLRDRPSTTATVQRSHTEVSTNP